MSIVTSRASRRPVVVEDWSLLSEEDKISRFNEVIEKYRERGFVRVRPRRVIPDTTNRGNTGLSARHAHFIACKMRDEGFTPRVGSGSSMRGHDLPILVRESIDSKYGRESYEKWRKQVEGSPGVFAPLPENQKDCFFTSLGNGHFFAALNLFAVEAQCLFDSGIARYSVASDRKLARAVRMGVQSVVLRPDIPRRERRFLSEVLNSAFTYAWDISDATVRITHVSKRSLDGKQVSQFEALSKSLDSFELDALVRQHRATRERERRCRTDRSRL